MTQHFDYTKPDSVEQAAALLAAGGHAIGGGTDLLTQVHRGIRTTEQLVDLRGLGLSGISHTQDGLEIGATTRLADLTRDGQVQTDYRVLARRRPPWGCSSYERWERSRAISVRAFAAGTFAIPT